MSNDEHEDTRKIVQWQSYYEAATGETGTVVDVLGKLGRFGGLAIWVEVVEDNGPEHTRNYVHSVYYSPYLNSSPFDGCLAEVGESCVGSDYDHTCDGHNFEADEDGWMDSMMGAANWEEWDWGAPQDGIPEH